MNKDNPKKNPAARRVRQRLPETCMARNRNHPLAGKFERATYSRTLVLKNGNGSKYDPVACDVKKGYRQ